MSVIIPKDLWHFHPDSIRFPIVQCPTCGSGMLGDDAPHGIKEDGSVYASVVCESCDFHRMIKLDEWAYGEIKKVVK